MNIFKELHRYRADYGVLVVLFLVFVAAFFYFWPNTQMQRSLITVLVVVYFFWGIVHHYRADRISIKIVLEYFFASALAGVILLLLTV